MEQERVFRASTSRAVGGAAMIFAALGGVSMLLSQSWAGLATFGGPVGLIGLFGYAGLWAAYVAVSPGGVTIRNIVRSAHVPWPAVLEVDGRYGLRLTTSYGKVTAWAAPAPAGRERLTGRPSEAAEFVQETMRRLEAQGHLENRRLESEQIDWTWHRGTVASGILLLVWSVAGPLVA